jgi:hypothetical protein
VPGTRIATRAVLPGAQLSAPEKRAGYCASLATVVRPAPLPPPGGRGSAVGGRRGRLPCLLLGRLSECTKIYTSRWTSEGVCRSGGSRDASPPFPIAPFPMPRQRSAPSWRRPRCSTRVRADVRAPSARLQAPPLHDVIQPRKSKPAEAAARSFTPACEAATVRDAIECCSEHSEKCSPAPQEPSAAPGLVEARHRGYPVRHRATRTAVGSKRHAPRKSCPRDFRRLCRLCLSELGLRSIINRSVGPTRHLPLGGMRQPGELAPNP